MFVNERELNTREALFKSFARLFLKMLITEEKDEKQPKKAAWGSG